MGAVKNGGEFAFITFDLLALVVAVEVTLFSVVGLAMRVVVHRPTNRCPFIANSLVLQHFQFDLCPFTWFERDGHLIRLHGWGRCRR